MKKFLPVIFSGLAAISFSQVTLAGAYGNKDSNAGAGQTDNPNVTRDAQGREHVNKGKHTGQVKNKKERDESSTSSSGSGSTSSDAATKRDNTSAETSGSARGEVK